MQCDSQERDVKFHIVILLLVLIGLWTLDTYLTVIKSKSSDPSLIFNFIVNMIFFLLGLHYAQYLLLHSLNSSALNFLTKRAQRQRKRLKSQDTERYRTGAGPSEEGGQDNP